MVFHSGSVKDLDGLPLIGAHIVMVGDVTKGTITDFDGNFQIEGMEGESYQIGHIGKKTRTITLKKAMPAATYFLVDEGILLDGYTGYAPKKKKQNVLWAMVGIATVLFAANKLLNT